MFYSLVNGRSRILTRLLLRTYAVNLHLEKCVSARHYRRFCTSRDRDTAPSSALPTFFITTPIYYLNSAPHIGHLYTTLIADVACRWQQMLGAPVQFSTGTDEHGLKVQQAAKSKGVDPLLYCNDLATDFKRLFQLADVDYTDFIRTSEQRHEHAVHHLWQTLESWGYIYRGKYEGWYCISDEAFLTDDEVMEVAGDKGNKIYVSKESSHPVEWTVEDNYVFRLSEFSQPLTEWLDKQVIVPEKFETYVRQFISQGLPDLSVSRSRARIPWGIPVPGDSTQTIYVWLDALTNYLTVGGYPHKPFHWPADCHIVGKDILRFHAIYWPAFLMAAGLEPPRKILCHSHWLMNKEKMSKSRGNVVDPFDRLSAFTVDGLRYYLMKDGVAHSDGNYSDSRAVECVNNDLVNTLCNLVSRCAAKSLNPQQIFPQFDVSTFNHIALDFERDIVDNLYQLADVVDVHYRSFNHNRAIEAAMTVLRDTNAFVQTHEPWLLAKSQDPDDHSTLQCILHIGLESARVAALALSPVTPGLSRRILERLGCEPDECTRQHMTRSLAGVRKLGKDRGPLLTRVKPSSVQGSIEAQQKNTV